MSGSMLSMFSNSDSGFCNPGVFNYAYVPSENSTKEYKNLSNMERQTLDQSFKRPLSEGYHNQQSSSEMSFYSSFQSAGVHLTKLNQSLTQSPRTVNRNPSTMPKIVGAEVKKNVKYEPVYMQRYSTSFEAEFPYQAHKPKRSSVAFGEDYTYRLDTQCQNRSQTIASPSPPPPSLEDVPMGGCVKDRVSFFNKLASQSSSTVPRFGANRSKETFLSLLRKNEAKDSKATINRQSQLMSSLSDRKSSPKEAMLGTNEGKCCAHGYKSGSNSLPMPLKRKSSFEKTRLATSSIAKNMNVIGTNLKRHSLMEDLSLVVPVRLRIAEFEKRILAAK